ncbi:MAG TPA: zinc-binding alcohol dehydrogenase family protein [Spirochaetia bacterium]|nr:zinc-binding alcohol dehydrogenase family protein [Spirochaetia bacterium]
MQAIRIIRPHECEVIEIPEPRIGAEEVLIKMKAMGLCGSDLSTYLGKNPLIAYPRIPGHEIAGEILEKGSSVPDNLRPGLRLTVSPYTSCGTCTACRTGRVNCCRANQTMGVQRDGAAAELIKAHYSKVIPAEGMEFERIAFIEPLSVGWHAASRGDVGPGDTVLVFGCGAIGLGAVVASAYKGGEVTAVDIDRGKLKKARDLGARHTINSREEDLRERVGEITGGHGPNVVIEAVGIPATYKDAVELVCFAGRIVYIGYASAPVEYETKHFLLKELDIRGSRNALTEDFNSVVRMLLSGTVDVKELISQRFPFAETGDALSFWESHQNQVTKILITY